MRGNSTDTRPAGQITGGKGRKLRFLIPLALVLAAALVACSSSSAREPAPDFPITIFQGEEVVGGQEINLRDLVGERPIVLNFWAGLCPPCRAELPDLQEFHEEFQDRVLTLGVDLGQFFGLGSQQDAIDLLNELGITYPTGSADGSKIIEEYEIFGIPATVFIDAQGEIFETRKSIVTSKILEETTLEILNQ